MICYDLTICQHVSLNNNELNHFVCHHPVSMEVRTSTEKPYRYCRYGFGTVFPFQYQLGTTTWYGFSVLVRTSMITDIFIKLHFNISFGDVLLVTSSCHSNFGYCNCHINICTLETWSITDESR